MCQRAGCIVAMSKLQHCLWDVSGNVNIEDVSASTEPLLNESEMFACDDRICLAREPQAERIDSNGHEVQNPIGWSPSNVDIYQCGCVPGLYTNIQESGLARTGALAVMAPHQGGK